MFHSDRDARRRGSKAFGIHSSMREGERESGRGAAPRSTKKVAEALLTYQ
jgi:hypothetical protein